MSNDRKDNSFQVGVMGLMFGFLAGAVAVILSDPDKREKVIDKAAEVFDTTKTTTIDTVNTLASTIKDKTEQMRKTVTEVVENAEKTLEQEIENIDKKDQEA